MPHQTIEFVHPTTPRRSPISRVVISHKVRWSEAWIPLPNARLDFAIWSCAPTMPRAQFTQRYGYGIQPGGSSFAIVPPLDVGRHYIRIELQYEAAAPSAVEDWTWDGGHGTHTWEDGSDAEWDLTSNIWTWDGGFGAHTWEDGSEATWGPGLSLDIATGTRWYGVVDVTADSQDGTTLVGATPVATGERTYLAYGMESILERHRVHRSEWIRNAETTPRVAESGLTFNLDDRGNMSDTEVNSGSHRVFEHYTSQEDIDGNKWNSREIVRYLFRGSVGVPMDQSGTDVFNWLATTEMLANVPNWDSPELETHLVSVYDLLNALVSRRRLVTWWLEVDEGLDVVRFQTATMTNVSITLLEPGSNIPANTNTLALRFDRHASSDVVLQTDTSHAVDQVIAYGARRTNTLTAEFGNSGSDHFRAGWDAAQKAAYELGGSSDPGYPSASEIAERQQWHAQARSHETVRAAFQRFVLRETLNYPPDDPDSYVMFFGSVRILPNLPLLEGCNYDGNRIASQNVEYPTTPNKLERRKPLVLIEIPGNAGKYVSLSEIGRGGDVEPKDDLDVRDWSATIRVPKDGHSLTIDVTGAPQHTIAYGDFSPRDEDEAVHGQWDWKTCRATICIADERFAEGKYPDDGSIASLDAKRIMRVPAGASYRLDYVRSGTIVDLEPDGTPITTIDDGFIKDARLTLASIAKAAHSWYSRERNAIRIRWPWDDPAQAIGLGHYVTTLQQAAVVKPVGAIVTQIEVQAFHFVGEEPRDDMPTMQVSIHTAFGELDYLRLRAVGGSSRNKEAKKT